MSSSNSSTVARFEDLPPPPPAPTSSEFPSSIWDGFPSSKSSEHSGKSASEPAQPDTDPSGKK
ncbi:hypothetical protein CC2G_013730 [Coprinopsis cinerea AmutBmut pab1-1]|nr:hypothetical protein CC2G_013730 [Coprinopsis cinerea AmutBmut pab1-1]